MSYLEKHNASGFKVGDRVKISKKCLSYSRGWDNGWVAQMDMWVGKLGKITEDRAAFGFRVDAMNDYWDFPYFVLEKVED